VEILRRELYADGTIDQVEAEFLIEQQLGNAKGVRLECHVLKPNSRR